MAAKLNADMIDGFVKMLLAKNFDNYKETPDCHRLWWDAFCSEHKRVAICAPRGHGKSTALTHCYTLAAALFRHKSYIIIVSDTYEQAVLFLQDIKKELINNEELIGLFGVEKIEKDAENDLIVRMAGGAKFRITAKGSEQRMRGLKWDSKRPDLIICDDLENDEIVQNQERRLKFRKWFDNALVPCLSDTGTIRIVGTILHLDSLLERLMPKDWDGKAVAKGDIVKEPLRSYFGSARKKTAWQSFRYRAHDESFENILWPTKWTKSRLQEERQRYIDAGNPEGYAQEYLNYPIDDTFAYFRKTDLLPMHPDSLHSNKKFYVGVDLAISEKSRADYSVFVVGGMDSEGVLHIVDVVRDRLDAHGIIECLFALNKRYKPEIVAIEASMIAKSLGPIITETMLKKGEFFNIAEMTPTNDKETRARSIQARTRAGSVRVNKEADWYSDFEQELLQFPKSRHDDQVDAFAWLGLIIDKMVEAPTPEEEAEDEYQDEFMMYQMDSDDDGRSKWTGY